MALASIAKIFARPNQCAVVEEPTYFLAGKMFADAGLRCVRVPVDSMGMDVDALAEWLKTSEVKPSLVYCIPQHHNPTSVNLDAAREAQLLSLADEHDFIVVYDDPYSLLPFQDSPPPPTTNTQLHSRLITLGSFSKILSPGLRLGWILSTPENIKRIAEDGALNSGGGPSNVITEGVRYHDYTPAPVHACLLGTARTPPTSTHLATTYYHLHPDIEPLRHRHLIDSGTLRRHIVHVRQILASRAAVLVVVEVVLLVAV